MSPPKGRTLAAVLFTCLFLLIPIGQAYSEPITTGVPIYICYPSEWSPLCITSVSQCQSGGCWVANVTNAAPSNITASIVDSVQAACFGGYCPSEYVIGQTVGITTLTINVPANGDAQAYLFVNGFVAGDLDYCMNVFAISPAGGSLSPTNSFACLYGS